MDDLSYFESRRGKLTSNTEDVFNFVTDIRNFEQFIPKGAIQNWEAERESCSLNVSTLGTVSFHLAEKESYNKVVFKGNALGKNDFSLTLNISDNGKDNAEVMVSLSASLNHILKMMAAKPIDQFLENLIAEMERFRGWENIKE